MRFIEKFEFTYQDYLVYYNDYKNMIQDQGTNEFVIFEEESEEYGTEETKNGKDKKHDKIFRDILQDKKEMAKFIGDFIKKEIIPEELENYNANYITKEFKYQQVDVIYKIKGKAIYYLVEHQTKVDYSMAYRMLNYCMEIIRNIVKNSNINRATYNYPKIIPIVIYTGDRKWTANKSFAQNKVDEDEDFKTIDIKYKLIDINKYNIKELLKQNSMPTNAMILEKCKNKEEVITNLQKIIKNVKAKEQFENLKRLVIYLYSDMQEKNKKEILELIEESECEEDMSTIAERLAKELRSERKIGITQGITQAITETIKRMIKMNLKNEIIKEATGAKEIEIEKIREELENI